MAMIGAGRGPSSAQWLDPAAFDHLPDNPQDPRFARRKRGMFGNALRSVGNFLMYGGPRIQEQMQADREARAAENELKRAQAEKALRPENTATQRDLIAAGFRPGTAEFQHELLGAVRARQLPDGIVMGPNGPQAMPGFMTPQERDDRNFRQSQALADRTDARAFALADRTDARASESQANQWKMLMERDRLQSERDERRRRDGLKVIPGSAAGAILDNEKQLRVLDDAIAEVSRNPKAFGGQNVLGNWAMQRLDPNGVNARSKVSNVGSLEIKERSGAAVTAAEFPRIAPFIPNATDTPEKVLQNLRNIRAIIADEVTTAKDFYSEANGYRPYVASTRPAPRAAPKAALPKAKGPPTLLKRPASTVPSDIDAIMKKYGAK